MLTPEDILNDWSTHGALWLIEDPNLLHNQAQVFRIAIQKAEPNKHMDFLRDMVSSSYERHRVSLAASHSSVEILTLLASDPSENVRGVVAENKDTPPDLLRALAKDADIQVLCEVAKNKNTPPDVLWVLATHNNFFVQQKALGNDNIPLQCLIEKQRIIMESPMIYNVIPMATNYGLLGPIVANIQRRTEKLFGKII